MTPETRELYRSSNGDRWYLARDPDSGRVFIKHEPNVSSGGRVSHIDIGTFLTAGGHGPEHQELLRLIGTLVKESTHAQGTTRRKATGSMRLKSRIGHAVSIKSG
jgi:hypothetical protein